jgi:hypothetical protein
MKAIHGGKSKNDRVDSPKNAALVRSGALPQTHVYPRTTHRAGGLYRARKRVDKLPDIRDTQYNLCSPSPTV